MFEILSSESEGVGEGGMAELWGCTCSLETKQQNQKQQLSTVLLLPCLGDRYPLFNVQLCTAGCEGPPVTLSVLRV